MPGDALSPFDLLRLYPAWLAALVLCMALGSDLVAGEAPSSRHPVAWLGALLERLAAWVQPRRSDAAAASARHAFSDLLPERPDWPAFRRGAVAWCAVALGIGLATWALQRLAFALPTVFAAAALGLLLKPLLAWRMLRDEVLALEQALADSLQAGRAQLAVLASRPAHELDEEELREAAIESLAENLNDSVVAPIFWFLLLGLPGAALYRFANTADAMWGYRGVHGGRDWTWAGRWAARADDILSWLPARITALLLLIVGGGASPRALWREARRTPSPNGGWPMAAMALVLGVRLRKRGIYALNAEGRAAQPADTRRAVRLAGAALALGVLPLLVFLFALSAR